MVSHVVCIIVCVLWCPRLSKFLSLNNDVHAAAWHGEIEPRQLCDVTACGTMSKTVTLLLA